MKFKNLMNEMNENGIIKQEIEKLKNSLEKNDALVTFLLHGPQKELSKKHKEFDTLKSKFLNSKKDIMNFAKKL